MLYKAREKRSLVSKWSLAKPVKTDTYQKDAKFEKIIKKSTGNEYLKKVEKCFSKKSYSILITNLR